MRFLLFCFVFNYSLIVLKAQNNDTIPAIEVVGEKSASKIITQKAKLRYIRTSNSTIFAHLFQANDYAGYFIHSVKVPYKNPYYDEDWLLMLFSVDRQGKPDKIVFQKKIVFSKTKKSSILTINLSEADIQFPLSGIFVALQPQSTNNFSNTAIGFLKKENSSTSWTKKPQGEWISIKQDNNFPEKLAINLIMELKK